MLIKVVVWLVAGHSKRLYSVYNAVFDAPSVSSYQQIYSTNGTLRHNMNIKEQLISVLYYFNESPCALQCDHFTLASK